MRATMRTWERKEGIDRGLPKEEGTEIGRMEEWDIKSEAGEGGREGVGRDRGREGKRRERHKREGGEVEREERSKSG